MARVSSAIKNYKKIHVVEVAGNEVPVSPPGVTRVIKEIFGNPSLTKIVERGFNSGFSVFEVLRNVPEFVEWVVKTSLYDAGDVEDKSDENFKNDIDEYISSLNLSDLYDYYDGIRKVWLPDDEASKKKLQPIFDLFAAKQVQKEVEDQTTA